MTDLRPNVVVHLRALDEPHPVWCDEHALPCRLLQHFVLTSQSNRESETPLAVVTAEGHR